MSQVRNAACCRAAEAPHQDRDKIEIDLTTADDVGSAQVEPPAVLAQPFATRTPTHKPQACHAAGLGRSLASAALDVPNAS